MDTNTCRGNCLNQIDQNTYEPYEGTNCEFKCMPVKCPNYIMCGSANPQCILDCHNGLCGTCDVMFGTWQGGKGVLETEEGLECPICLDTKTCISQPNCNHKICVDCFKRCYFGGEKPPEPQFPYSDELYQEYLNWNEEDYDQQWSDDPLIIKYKADWVIYEHNEHKKYESEKHLRKCGLCRK